LQRIQQPPQRSGQVDRGYSGGVGSWPLEKQQMDPCRLSVVAALMVFCGCTQTRATDSSSASATTAVKSAGADAVVSPGREVGAAGAADSASATGYHVIERNGIKYYCADKPALGTRIKSRVACLTAEQYEVARAEAIDTMREKQGQRQTFPQQ
jgi:hypothetical protein